MAPADRPPPRVLFLDQSGQPGGAELFLADVAQSLGEKCKVVLFQDGPFREILESRGVPTLVLPLAAGARQFRKDSGLLTAIRALAPAVRLVAALARQARQFDVIYANTPKAILLGALAARLSDRPLIVHLHDLLVRNHFHPAGIRLLVFAANSATAVIANSNATARAFRAAGGRPRGLHIIPNGIDPSLFQPLSPDRRREIRAGLGIREECVVGVFGRLTRWKGQHILLDALAQLPHIHGCIVGGAFFTGDDQVYATELRERAKTLGISQRTHFLGFRNDVAELMAAMDVVVHTSIAPEPFGRVIVEAMLSECPVIAASEGAVAEIIQPEVTGLLVEPGNSEVLRKAIAQLAVDPARRTSLGRAARLAASEHFGLSEVLHRVHELIFAVGGAPSPPAESPR